MRYVKNLARRLHSVERQLSFSSLTSRKLLIRSDLLHDMGFPSKFRDCISALLSTSSSEVLLNGIVGTPIKHGRGLRQGDHLSPLLFVLAIDPLHHILRKATEQGHLHKLMGRAPTVASLFGKF